MDTISRENNPSVLPFIGIGAGVLGCILALVAFVKAGQVKKLSADVEDLKNQVQSVSGDISAARDTANRANSYATNLAKQTQSGFDQMTANLAKMQEDINKLATLKTAPAAATKDGKAGAAAAKPGPGGDYTVKQGDYPAKIARAHGVSTEALMAANPGLDPSKLKIGQKINLPK